jgi:hypothetical protein
LPLRFIGSSKQEGLWKALPKWDSLVADAPQALARKLYESSLNWSGAYLLPTPGKRFVQVWGGWVVRPVRAPKSDSSSEYQCSTWIGLDGQRRYANSTLPQIGTLQKVRGEEQQTTAWVQWWQRNDPESTPETLNFPVAIGDRVSCVLTVLTKPDWPGQGYDQSVLFNIVNQTKQCALAMRIDPPPIEKGRAPRLWIPGATAEWVMERPAILEEQTLQELADYGTTKFCGCIAAEATETSPDKPMPRDLTKPWLIRMYEVRDKNRIGYISTPTPPKADATSFEVKYEN